MPTVNLFLPPLLGGFIFVSLWVPLRYWAQRERGYEEPLAGRIMPLSNRCVYDQMLPAAKGFSKLVFAASVAGGLFLLLAHLLVVAFQEVSPFREGLAWWRGVVSIDNSAQAVLGFLLGATLWWPLNLLRFLIPALRVEEIVRRQILQAGDPLEITLIRHLETQAPLAVTLRSGKVYVGRVVSSINPAKRVESVQLRLVRSGYRDELTHELTLNIDYETTHARVQARIEEIYTETVNAVVLEHPHLSELDIVAEVYRRAAHLNEMSTLAHDFEVVIVAQEIVSVSSFNPELFEAYFDANT